jgi:glycosyltransferase involved in cell wall biosynthesis
VPDDLVTVVVPAFNARATLTAALLSVAAERGRQYDVIVVDDGSQDGTGDLAHQLGVRCIRQENAGPGAARNAGIHAAGTPLIAFLDADDTVPMGGIQRRVELLGDADLLVTGADQVYGESGRRLRFEDIAWAPAIIRSPSGWVARRDALCAVGGFRTDLRCLEDVELTMRMAADGLDVRISSADTFTYSGVTPGRRLLLAEALLSIAREVRSPRSPFARVSSEAARKRLAAKYLRHAANVYAAASDRAGLRATRSARVELELPMSPELALAAFPRTYAALVHLVRRQTRRSASAAR